MATATLQLTDEQIDSVNRDGFLRVPRITSNEEALKIRATLERLFAERAGWKEGAYGDLAAKKDKDKQANSPQILLPVNYAPELHRTDTFLNALEMAKQILGEEAAFVLDLTILKRAGSGEPTPWHQDDAFRDPQFEYKEVTIWVALQDVDEKSGCLMFIPESHGERSSGIGRQDGTAAQYHWNASRILIHPPRLRRRFLSVDAPFIFPEHCTLLRTIALEARASFTSCHSGCPRFVRLSLRRSRGVTTPPRKWRCGDANGCCFGEVCSLLPGEDYVAAT